MKKVIIFCSILLMVNGISFAQISQGKLSIGGSFNFQMDKEKTENQNTTVKGPNTTEFGFSPSIEYFVTDNISGGLEFSVNSSVTKDYPGNSDKDKSTIFGISPFLRYYLGPDDKFKFFGQASLGLGFGNSVHEEDTGVGIVTTKTKINAFEIGIRPGIYFSLSDKVAIESTIGFFGFNSYTQKYPNDVKDSNSSFGLSLNTATIYFGFRYSLN
jgi:hypothetical protein